MELDDVFDTFMNLIAGAGSAAYDHGHRYEHREGFFGTAPGAAERAAWYHRQGNANEASWWAGRTGEAKQRGWF